MADIRAEILLPKKGDHVGSRVNINGCVTTPVPALPLWIAHRRVRGGIIWPKEQVVPDESGNFSIIAFEGGTPGDIVISLLAVTEPISNEFKIWLKIGNETNNYPGIDVKELPVQELAAVEVVYDNKRPLRIFYSYSHHDEDFRNALEKHLAILKRNNLIETWHDRCITGGTLFNDKIQSEIDQADIILLLVSSSFIASDYCYQKEMMRAMERHKRGEARVVPIIVRSVDWEITPFADLQALPTDGKPIRSWADQDEAWTDVTKGLREIIKEIR